MDRTQLGRTDDRVAAEIRPVVPADLAVLSDFFAGLSVESRYLRFFAPVTPTHGLLDLLSGGPAHVDAIVAVADGVIVGHAMAADRPEDHREPCGSRATDIGVLVIRAQARGVTSLAMDVLPGNRQVLAMIVGHWPDAAIAHSPDSLDIRIPLPRYQPRRQQHLRRRPPRPASGLVRPLVTLGG
jgi:hypothetical protein